MALPRYRSPAPVPSRSAWFWLIGLLLFALLLAGVTVLFLLHHAPSGPLSP